MNVRCNGIKMSKMMTHNADRGKKTKLHGKMTSVHSFLTSVYPRNLDSC